LETVFQIDAFQNSNWEVKSATDILSKNIRKSILSTQLFPTNSKFYNSDVDISGITGKGGQIIKNGKVKILNQFTDEIEVIREDGMTENKSNIGRYGNVVIDPKDYTKEIIEGFREGYVLLENNKEELLKLINVDELFYDACPRYLFRNTNLYATILEMSKNPKYLKDKLEPERLFHLLFNTSNNHKIEKIYQSELGELLNGDIPYFCGCVNDKIIYNFNGDRCFVLDRAPLIEVKERIDNLNQKDMITQVDFIIKSMTIQKKTWNSIREKLDYNTIGDINNKDSLIEAAKNIGDLLISEAIIDEKTETISWLDIQNTFPTWTIRAQDSFLYSGLVGNAIFFSSLYFETKEIKYQRIMEKILNTIRIDLDRINNQPISTFNGIISVAYLYAFLYKQTKDKDMLQESINIIIQNKEKILENTSYDIIDGLAGILIVVLNIYELSEDKELQDLAINIGEKIIKNIQIIQDVAYWEKYNETELIIAGFSHGLAGVTYGLGKLYKKASFKESISLITNLVKIENSYYSNDIENWIDLRSEEKLSLNNSPIHWCHGATGIGLSRLKNKDIMDVSEDLDKAFKTVIKNGLYRDSDCLCHGNMGNIEFLLQIFLESQDRSLYTKIIKRVNEIIIENQCQNGYINGVGQKFSSLSFMLGLPGIGYGMLRISEPEKYPSVLLLEV
jgi:type 2 lantibiotic biosynthesis protein LanM